MMKYIFSATLLSLTMTAAGANDIDIKELAPCKPAAMRYCERVTDASMSNLIRCGATLAAKSDEVGSQCRQVLRRYSLLHD
jgi:hypothetical protein